MAELGVSQAELVTLHDEETVRLDTGVVRGVPAWRWLLESGETRSHGSVEPFSATTS